MISSKPRCVIQVSLCTAGRPGVARRARVAQPRHELRSEQRGVCRRSATVQWPGGGYMYHDGNSAFQLLTYVSHSRLLVKLQVFLCFLDIFLLHGFLYLYLYLASSHIIAVQIFVFILYKYKYGLGPACAARANSLRGPFVAPLSALKIPTPQSPAAFL